MANNIKDQIIENIERNDPNYKIIDLTNVNDFLDDDRFLPRILDNLNTNSYVGKIIWPVNKPIYNEIVELIEKKIKENNWNFERFPNYFVHCLLSSHVYTVSNEDINKSVEFKNDLKKYNNCLENWIIKVVNDKQDTNGYLGVIYLNEKKKQMVVAHKGTVFKKRDVLFNTKDIYTDIIGILNGEKVDQQVECKELILSAIEISKKGTIYNVSITGHSLGVLFEFLFIFNS
jgi:hypothetical protein